MTIENALNAVAERTGQKIVYDAAGLLIGAHRIPLPETGKWDDLHARHALPYSAHGEARENLLYWILQDAGKDRVRKLDTDLYEKLPSAIDAPGLLNTEMMADAMRREYWWSTRPKRGHEEHHLLPFHAQLPTGFDRTSRSRRGLIPARFKMFAGYILPFLTWDGRGPDGALIDELLAKVSSVNDFTLLDELFLGAAKSLAEGDAPPLSAEELVARARRRGGDVLAPLEQGAGGPFCQHSFDLFRRDLKTLLGLDLPRSELIRAVTLVLSLHLAVYYYRFALVLAQEVEGVTTVYTAGVAPIGCACTSVGTCSLAGAIRFRAPSNGFRPVSIDSPCRQSYIALDRDRLLALPANIVTANLMERAWAALTSEPGMEGTPRPARIASALITSPDMRAPFDAATGALAVLYAQQAGSGELTDRVAHRSPGPFALQSAVLQARRTRLKYTSRDVVNQLAYRPGDGTLLRRNGPSLYYFELDDEMLFLLVKLVCGRRTIPFEQFISGLAEYGLAPQDTEESDALSATLEQFGMLNRYSDAGESTFVHDLS